MKKYNKKQFVLDCIKKDQLKLKPYKAEKDPFLKHYFIPFQKKKQFRQIISQRQRLNESKIRHKTQSVKNNQKNKPISPELPLIKSKDKIKKNMNPQWRSKAVSKKDFCQFLERIRNNIQ